MSQLAKSDDESNSNSTVILTPADTEPVEANDDTNEVKDDAVSTKDKDADGEDKKTYLKGMVSDSKTLYAKFDERGNRSWSEKKPADFEEAAEGEETQKFAIIVRKRKLDVYTSANHDGAD